MKTKATKNFFIFCLALLFVLSPISPLNFFLQENENASAREQQIISDYQEWTTDREIDGKVKIEEGAVLVIKKGVKITFKNDSSLYVYGKLFVKGTREEPVKFSLENAKEIEFGENETIEYFGYRILVRGEAVFRNADFSGGGDIFQKYLKGNNILNKTYAADSSGVILVQGGGLDASECNFHDNVGGVQAQWVNEGNKIRVNKTIFENNYSFDVRNDYTEGGYTPDFMYNWWGNPNGPEFIDSEHNIYKYILGNVNFSNWLTSKNFRDPVIIIPGILGSEQEDGIWKIDPVFHIYDNLYKEFENVGYVSNKSLFTFAYDWRKSNVENAKLLKAKIQEIKQQEKWPEVDVVAHSMGGLLTREYIEADDYGNDINQLITLGTPHHGSPEAYLKWEAGAFLSSPAEIYLNCRFSQEAEENGYGDIFQYIQDKIPAVRELLPVYGYLYDVENDNKLIEYSEDNYPINDFLENLNDSDKKEKLLKVEYDKIIGNVSNNESTIVGFNIIKRDMGEHWEHGYPHSLEIPLLGDRGLIYNNGDETVPLISAESEEIYSDRKIEINSSHRDLPTSAQLDVVEILTGTRLILAETESHVKDILIGMVFSPIDIQIIDKNGNWVGKNIKNLDKEKQIDGAYYSGYETVEGKENKNEFITIPNPENGEYQIITEGTGSGEYKIKMAKISENEDDPQNAKETETEIIGTATLGDKEELKIEVKENEIAIKQEDETPPETKAELSGIQGNNNWYTGDATITLSAEDNEGGSGIEKTEYSLDSGATWQNYSDPIVITQEEKNTIQYFSTDKQGNKEETKTAEIKIDKTAPEAKLIFNKDNQKLDIIGVDNLSQNVNIQTQEQKVEIQNQKNDRKNMFWFFNLLQKPKETKTVVSAILTDEAGHQTEIVWEKKTDKDHRIDLSISSISYDGQKTDISNSHSNSQLQYKWMLNWIRTKYLLFASHINTNSTSIESHYFPKFNQTWLMERPIALADDDSNDDAQKRPVWKKMPGMAIPGIMTNKGELEAVY